MDLFDLKGILEDLTAGLHIDAATFAPSPHPMFHPGRGAVMSLDGAPVGVLGELHPIVRERWELPAQPVMIGEFDLEAILDRTDARFLVKPLSRFPVVMQDIALVVDESIPAARVAELIHQTGGSLLAQLRLFDVYRGEPLPAGTKSLAYNLTFQAPDRVLSDKDAAKLRDKIVMRLVRELGAQLRSG
jgi:phenylalanyl-tRNA synthetase beta chain